MSRLDIPCPQCKARGEVPGSAYGCMQQCRLCRGVGYTTISNCLLAGWPEDVLREVTNMNKGELATAMLIEGDE